MNSFDTLKQAAQALRRAKDAHEFAEMKQPGYGHAEDAKLCAELTAALAAMAAQEPAAWISTVMCVGSEYGKERYGKLPIQSLQPGYYKHTPLYTAPTTTSEHDSKVRDAALEEAAQVCEARVRATNMNNISRAMDAEDSACAYEIRALKST